MTKKDKTTNNGGRLVNIVLIILMVFLVITTWYISGISCSIFLENKQNVQQKGSSVTVNDTKSKQVGEIPSSEDLSKEWDTNKQQEILLSCKLTTTEYDIESVQISKSEVIIVGKFPTDSSIEDYINAVESDVKIYSYDKIEDNKYNLKGIIK